MGSLFDDMMEEHARKRRCSICGKKVLKITDEAVEVPIICEDCADEESHAARAK